MTQTSAHHPSWWSWETRWETSGKTALEKKRIAVSHFSRFILSALRFHCKKSQSWQSQCISERFHFIFTVIFCPSDLLITFWPWALVVKWLAAARLFFFLVKENDAKEKTNVPATHRTILWLSDNIYNKLSFSRTMKQRGTWVMWRRLAGQERSLTFSYCLRTSAIWREVMEVWNKQMQTNK